MSKWIIEDDSVLYDYNEKYVIQITKEDNGLRIKTIEKNPPVGRTNILYCRFLNNEHLGLEVPIERQFDKDSDNS